MEKFGFPLEFIKWTKLGFTSTQASLIINGKLTSFFELPGGGRQGDNLFPLIFAVVVQGLASLINKSDAVGIKIGDTYHKIVQYADDSTLLVSEDSDWAFYNSCITIFCDASGMVINWDKSKGLWLGTWITIPPKLRPLGCHPALNFIPNKEPERILGAYMGTNIPLDDTWTRLNQKLQKSLSSVMRHCGDEIGDTITVNALLISSAIFSIRVQYVPRIKLQEINKMATKFIRGKVYMTRDSQRYSSKVHGAVVPLIDIANLATTLQANWFYKILNPDEFHTSTLLFEPLWLANITEICQQHHFKCLDHMILSDIDWLKEKPKDKKHIAPFPNQCAMSYCAMRFTRDIDLNFESIMNQPIFHNPKLINPHTLESWKQNEIVCKIYRLADLFIDFDIHKYRLRPCIISLENPIWNSHLLSAHFSTPKKQCLVTSDTWDNLIISIPQDWMDTITRGNQFFNKNEFFSTIPPLKDALGTIFRYLDNDKIQRYITSNKGLLTPIDGPVTPGSPSNLDTPHPAMSDLKRVTVFTTQPLEYDPKLHHLNIHLTTFTLPYYPKVSIFSYNHNVLKGCYTHINHPVAKFKDLKKIWRLSPPFSAYHPRTYEFIDKIGLLGIKVNEKVGLKLILNTIQQADISPLKRLMLTRIINKSLYIGQPAYEYQTVIKHVHPTNTAKITPPHCIYNLYTNPLALPIEATYEHLLWHSPQAQYVWNLTKKIIIQLGAKFEITSLYEIPLVFLPNAETTPSLRTSTVQHIIVASLWVIYKSELDLRTLHQTNAVTIDTIRYWMSSHLHKTWVHEITAEIQHLPHTAHFLRTLESYPNIKGRLTRRFTYRQSALFHREYLNLKKLSSRHIELFEDFWTKTELVKIVDQRLEFTPYHLYPP